MSFFLLDQLSATSSFSFMSSLDKSYSKEFRSYYSRSASSSANDQRSARNERPLSTRLVERDYSSPAFERPADDRYTFDRRAKEFSDDFERRRRRFFSASFEDLMNDDEFFPSFNEKKAPLNYRDKPFSSSASRTIPVQYVPSSSYHQEKNYRKVDFAPNSFERDGKRSENMRRKA